NTTVTGLHRPARPAIPANGGTVIGRIGTFTTHLVEAPPFATTFVAPFLDEAASVVMRAAFTLIVNDLAVSEQRPLKLIDCRQVTESQVMNEHGRSVRYVVWTAAKIDHLQAGDRFL